MARCRVLFESVVSSCPYMLSFEINLCSIANIFRYCNQSIAVRVVIVCFRLSDFLFILSRTAAEQTSSTGSIDNIALSQSYVASVCRMLHQQYLAVGLYVVSPRHLSAHAVSRLGSSASLVGKVYIVHHSYYTKIVINAASVNIWPQIALDIVLPVNIYMSDSIASEQYFEELLQSCACHYMSNATKEAHLHVKTY